MLTHAVVLVGLACNENAHFGGGIVVGPIRTLFTNVTRFIEVRPARAFDAAVLNWTIESTSAT